MQIRPAPQIRPTQLRRKRNSPAALARWARLGAALLASACIQVVQTAPPQEPEPRVPTPLASLEDPKLQPTDVEGLFAAPALDPTLYYYKPDDLWYRYAYRRWFQAFRWDGAWFVPEKVPDAVKARVPAETPTTLKGQLKDLDKKLENLDRDEKLKQQEKQLEELDRQDREKQQQQQPQGSGTPPPSAPPAH